MIKKKHISISVFLLLFLLFKAGLAQDSTETDKRFKVFTYQGQTYMSGQLEGIDITAKKPNKREIRRGRRRLAKFTRLRWNVHKVYPYAAKVSNVLEEINAEMEALPDDEARKQYVKSKEKSLFGSYEKDIRRMTRSQGRVLVKLVSRETGESTYKLIKETKSGAAAFFWQSIGLLFGINLKTGYDLEEDAMIEQIVEDLENGGYNIAYKRYNYSLK